MPVIRVKKTKDYTIMSNYHFKDKRLSLKAKGLISEMLSLPDEWDYSIAGLVSLNQENESAIKTALKELKNAGYLEIKKILPNKENNGRIEYEYILHEMPIQQEKKQEVEIQPLENQGIGNLSVENQPQLNTNILNIKEENTKVLNTEDKKKERKKEMSFDEILDSVPVIRDNPSLRDTFIEYIKMRKLIKHPLTDRALQININEAYKLSKGDPVLMQKLVEQSISRSYRGIFPLDEGKAKPQNNPQEFVNPFTEIKRRQGRI